MMMLGGYVMNDGWGMGWVKQKVGLITGVN